MDDAGLVCFRERIGHLAGNLKRLLERRTSASQQLPEGRAFDELHHDEELPVEFPDVVDGDDPGVVQRRRRSCFVLEAPDGARVGQRFDAENFDGDLATELRIPCAIDLAHAAGAEQSKDLVSAALGTRSERHLFSYRQCPETAPAVAASSASIAAPGSLPSVAAFLYGLEGLRR
jgi:hypothetical protein